MRVTKLGDCRVVETPVRNAVMYSAWVPCEPGQYAFTTVLEREAQQLYGRLGTGILPDRVRSLRYGSRLRSSIRDAQRLNEHEEAYRAILEAYPEAINGNKSNGFIIVEAD